MHLPQGQAEHLRIAQELPGKVQHMSRIRGGKERGQQGAAREITLNFFHIRVKADGQHAVGLVKDQDFKVFEGKRAAQQMIQHTPRRAHNNLNARLERVKLFAVAHTAIHGADAEAGAVKQKPGLALYLTGQLARGSENKRLYALVVCVEAIEQGEQVGSCLAAARTGLNHDIAPGHEVGQGVGLYRHEARP